MVKGTIKKSGIDDVISKSSSKKSTNIMDCGKKQTTTNYVSVKTTSPYQTTKKSNTENTSGKISSSVTTNIKKSTTNYATSSSINCDKKDSPNRFGEKGGSSGSHGFPTVVPQLKSVADKKYVSSSYMDPKNKKSSITLGIIWLPMKRRNKFKDNLRNSETRDQSKERTPSMYNFMAEGSSGQIETNKDKDLVSSGALRMTAPVQIGSNAGAPLLGHKNLDDNIIYTDIDDDQDENAGVSSDINVNGCKEDAVNQEANADKPHRTEDVDGRPNTDKAQHKGNDVESSGGKEDCIVVWLDYVLKCSDCTIL